MAYTVTFWGTRGSIPTPGAHTARYGGNTPCVAVEGTGGHKGGGQLVILDAGTGIRALGRELVEHQNGAVQAEILLSHAHWDHIQGLAHFKPFFAPGNAVRIWARARGRRRSRPSSASRWTRPYSPCRWMHCRRSSRCSRW